MALNLLKEADFRKLLKRNPTGGFLFFGDEDYMKSACLRMARAAIAEADPTAAAFNDIRQDGTDFTPGGLLGAMVVPPIGSERKIITVTGLNFNTMRASDMDKLTEALAAIPDYPYNLVILSAAADTLDGGTLPKRPSELLTGLSEYLQPVWFERNSPQKLAGWVQKHYSHDGVEAAPAICHFTVDYCGRNMFTLAGEIEKIAYYVLAAGRTEVTEDDIRAAAVPTMEYDAFAFTNAIMERRRTDALDILRDLKFRRVEPLYILAEVSRVICDLAAIQSLSAGGRTAAEIASSLHMNEYRVTLYLRQTAKTNAALLHHAVSACAQADRAMKSSSADGYGLIERLICTL